MPPIITAQNLTKTYGQQIVFQDLNFQIQPGEVVGLIGNNGAGKTTLLNLLIGLQRPTAGQIHLFADNLSPMAIQQKRGIMFQDDFGLSRVTVQEMLALACSLYAQPLSLSTVLHLTDLNSQTQQYVSKLSGGQKRRLNWGLALAGNPELLFLDEPTSGMDTTSRHHFWQAIQELNAQGKTIIVTSHYLAEIDYLAQHILFLKDHQLIHNGTLADLKNKYSQIIVTFDSSQDFTQHNFHQGILQDHQQNHYIYQVTSSEQFVQELNEFLPVIQHLRIHQKNLDEIFQQVNQGE